MDTIQEIVILILFYPSEEDKSGNSFYFNGIQFWNSLPKHVKMVNNFSHFKSAADGGGNVHLSGQLAECAMKFGEQVDKRALVGIVTGHGNKRGVACVSN